MREEILVKILKPKNTPADFAHNLHTLLTSPTMRGQDYYDFMILLQKKIQPDMDLLANLLGTKMSLGELEERLDIKIYEATTKYKNIMQSDLSSLENQNVFVNNYRSEYFKYKAHLFTRNVRLFLRCKGCKKEFDSNISVTNEAFNEMVIKGRQHLCSHCQFENVVNKCDYIIQEEN